MYPYQQKGLVPCRIAAEYLARGRHRDVKLSIHDGSKVKLAPLHSDFDCDFIDSANKQALLRSTSAVDKRAFL